MLTGVEPLRGVLGVRLDAEPELVLELVENVADPRAASNILLDVELPPHVDEPEASDPSATFEDGDLDELLVRDLSDDSDVANAGVTRLKEYFALR